jgi:hypothetical protein
MGKGRLWERRVWDKNGWEYKRKLRRVQWKQLFKDGSFNKLQIRAGEGKSQNNRENAVDRARQGRDEIRWESKRERTIIK